MCCILVGHKPGWMTNKVHFYKQKLEEQNKLGKFGPFNSQQ